MDRDYHVVVATLDLNARDTCIRIFTKDCAAYGQVFFDKIPVIGRLVSKPCSLPIFNYAQAEAYGVCFFDPRLKALLLVYYDGDVAVSPDYLRDPAPRSRSEAFRARPFVCEYLNYA